ncbi:hypothetical protein IMSAGC018_01919 [Lachnospiraceae bacterium]|nr:hypothetical protein IMSAGC018_01919 [Lachnospiraceae bacterium]
MRGQRTAWKAALRKKQKIQQKKAMWSRKRQIRKHQSRRQQSGKQRAAREKVQRSRQKAAQREKRRAEPYREMKCRSQSVPVRKGAAPMILTKTVKYALLITRAVNTRHRM